VSEAQATQLQAFKEKLAAKKTVAPSDLDELIGILFRT
jgi:hypothetical protein